MGTLQRTPGKAPTAFSQDYPRLRRRERISLVKNRMREICTSGSGKWNKIEHRLFSFITINWRGKPLRSYRTIVQLIAATTTEAGLKVRAELDENKYPKGVKVSDLSMAAVNLTRHSFHGDWNYTISPHQKTPRKNNN
jgi:hypothetical protein